MYTHLKDTQYLYLLCFLNSITEVEAKDVHRSLKVAAGIFKALKVRSCPQVSRLFLRRRKSDVRLD